ncbi:response regulator transcription factor [Alsobacter sp. KACC 23698]|uniref:Response regulator transcription factor n=1 Tax=Alsobacter sp. KACC 23698 TaxID=3149229 RepID=A0AAU7JEQ9_9HYPH
MPRLLIADDHGLYRKGLRCALEAAIPDAEVTEADGFDGALARLEDSGAFDLVLLDLNMPGLVFPDSLREVRACYPRMRFAILSASDTRADMLASLAAGANGFISKLQMDEEIVAAVEDILSGRIYVTPLMVKATVSTQAWGEAGPARPAEPVADVDYGRLTPRQRDVLPLVARGLSNKEIARELKIAEATTKIHMAALLRVLGVRNRTEAAVRAQMLLTRGDHARSEPEFKRPS